MDLNPADRQPASPQDATLASGLLSPPETERLAPHLAGFFRGVVLLIGPASLDLLRALAGSASRILLVGPDQVALRLQRRALIEDRVEEVDMVVARPASMPIRKRGAGGALLIAPAGSDPAVRQELGRITGDAPALAIVRVRAARANGNVVLATAAGLALCHLTGRLRAWPSPLPSTPPGSLPSTPPGSLPSTPPGPSPPAARTSSLWLPSSKAITVVIPTRNRAPLLSRALESLLAQEVGPAEIVVVDDGSTDDTGAAIERSPARARYGSTLRTIRRDAAGQGAAMNAGIAAATGDWIAWLDDDDYFLPAKLRLQLRTLDDPRVGLSVTAHYIGNASGRPLEARQLPQFGDDEVLRLLLRGSIFLGPTAIVRRAAYAELGDRPYDESLPRAADYALWWHLARRWRVAVLQVPLTVVCRHPGNELDIDRARTIYDSVRRTLRWAWESVPLAELAGARATIADVQLERAAALLRAGLWAEARADLEAVRDREPERAGNFFGLAALESGDLRAAETHFDAVLRHAPQSLEGLNGLATVLVLAGRRTEAKRLLARALAAHPHDPLTRYNEALATEPRASAPGPALLLARDLLAERGLRGALFSPAPPLRGIDAFFATLRRESWPQAHVPPPPA